MAATLFREGKLTHLTGAIILWRQLHERTQYWKGYGRKRLWPNRGASTGKTVQNRRKPSSRQPMILPQVQSVINTRHKPARYVSSVPLEGKQGVRTSRWMVRGSNPGEVEIFRARPDRPGGPPSLLCNWYRVSFPGVKRPGRGVDHLTPM
jgi:hypothetical protein